MTYQLPFPDDLCEVKLFNGMTTTVSLSSIAEIREIYKWGVYESVRPVRPGDIVVDAGAEVGTFTLKAALQGASCILAFEPYPPTYEVLRRNVSKNITLVKNAKILTYNAALAHVNGSGALYVQKDPGSNSLVMSYGNEPKIDVRLIKLDDVLKNEDIDHINFLKIDVEGAADHVLNGASNILDNSPNLLVAAAVYHFPGERDEVRRILEEKGFELAYFNNVGQPDTKYVSFIHGWKK